MLGSGLVVNYYSSELLSARLYWRLKKLSYLVSKNVKWLLLVQKRYVKFVDRAIILVEGVEEHVSFVLFVSEV